MEYEIDLRRYAAALARRWYWVVLGALIAAITAGSVSMLLPKTYTATASVLVLIRQTGSELGTNQPVLSIETIDVGARRQGLVALAGSDAIEAKLPPDVIRRVAPPNYKPGMFIKQENILVATEGDLLTITAKAATPVAAKTLADAWASTFIDDTKTLYTDGNSELRLVGSAVLPFQPASPKIVKNIALAGVAGALIGVLAVLIAEISGVTLGLPGRRRREQLAKRPSPSH